MADTDSTLRDSLSSEPRRRLLEAAGEVFAEQGYRSATIRDICSRAGANVAAVNYHFGDKEQLYREVFRQARCRTDGLDATLTTGHPPERRLAEFVGEFVRRMFGEGMPAWHEKLMSREMVEPTPEFKRFVEEDIRPRHKLMTQLVRESMGAAASEGAVRRSVNSIIGQVLFYHHASPVLRQLLPGGAFDAQHLEDLACHITRFSLAGIREVAKKQRGGKP